MSTAHRSVFFMKLSGKWPYRIKFCFTESQSNENDDIWFVRPQPIRWFWIFLNCLIVYITVMDSNMIQLLEKKVNCEIFFCDHQSLHMVLRISISSISLGHNGELILQSHWMKFNKNETGYRVGSITMNVTKSILSYVGSLTFSVGIMVCWFARVKRFGYDDLIIQLSALSSSFPKVMHGVNWNSWNFPLFFSCVFGYSLVFIR